ncbi:DNA binding protein [Aureococcus anophagefferens]|nr:DNA binding protein [Aureococcus anophagefferens]
MADGLLPVASFVRTVWTMVTNEEETLIAWSPDGERIVIADPPRFAAEVCPRYFRHNKWTSFARLLNMYEFHKCPINPVDGSNRRVPPRALPRAEGELHRIERKKWTPKSEAKTPAQKRARADNKANNKAAPESERPPPDDGDGVPELDSATFMELMTSPFSCFTPRGAESPVTPMAVE